MSSTDQSSPETFPRASYCIREIDSASAAEVEWVARGMRQTLIEVEGEEAGTALYSMDWLRDRVRWHLDPGQVTAKVFVAVDPGGRIVGHTIVRIEAGEDGLRYGLVSTTYVEPASRKQAVADQLLRQGESWMAGHALPEAATWTSASNTKLINLYAKHGYTVTAHHTHEVTKTHMIRLTKMLSNEGGAAAAPEAHA